MRRKVNDGIIKFVRDIDAPLREIYYVSVTYMISNLGVGTISSNEFVRELTLGILESDWGRSEVLLSACSGNEGDNDKRLVKDHSCCKMIKCHLNGFMPQIYQSHECAALQKMPLTQDVVPEEADAY